ncbi:hypothetical protein CBR_g37268 [Chara braunii]|uniref:Uncharacterized protein n=1 Tax=Chara braunii TaxID=69332 RepID=A0A388LMQ3_CHABU|nr:hypothetical protein CBR_g37268 [Chara braunii]|eukprot:GBG83551.1 hypothetical protein CBR_g37268 [Chara braunii]
MECDPWMKVPPFTDAPLDSWKKLEWDIMLRECPWADDYKFANMCEFGSFIPVPRAVLGSVRCHCLSSKLNIPRHQNVLVCSVVTASPCTWSRALKFELLVCARHSKFLDQYPLRSPRLSPRAVSYCCVRLRLGKLFLSRVLCVACSNRSRTLTDAVVYVSRNELHLRRDIIGLVTIEYEGTWDLVIGAKVDDVDAWREVEAQVSSIRDAIGSVTPLRPSTSVNMSPETHTRLSPEKHMRLAKPFSPCATSVRHHDGQTWIDEAAKEDFDEDPWMTAVPYMNRHLDEWNDNDWKAMERVCPWASHYKFANMLEFGNLIALPDGVLQRKTLDDKGKPIRYRTSFRRRLHCEYIISSPRTWGSSQKQELVDCTRHCSFLEHYPPRCPGTSPQAISYCCVRLTDDRCPFAGVLCVASSDKTRKLVDAVVLVSWNEMVQQDYKFKPVMSRPDVDGRSDFVRAGQVRCLELFYEVEQKMSVIRDYIGNSLAR